MAVSLEFESALGDPVMGIDEAGRGPLAGAVYAAAVHVPLKQAEKLLAGDWAGINDSKKLTGKKRDALAGIIKSTEGCVWAIASASPGEIDRINILQATYLAMERAVAQLSAKPDLLLIDGNRAKDFGIPAKTVVHGDSLSASIAAASVLAKVTRDDIMVEMAEKYPQYGFEIHKGYGTKAHYEALREHGHCPIHRMSFLKKFYGEK